jgi:hypothetical protein
MDEVVGMPQHEAHDIYATAPALVPAEDKCDVAGLGADPPAVLQQYPPGVPISGGEDKRAGGKWTTEVRICGYSISPI